MATTLLVMQHTPWEGPGKLLLAAASRHRLRLAIFRAWQDPLPDLQDYQGLIILGGSPNVDQEKQYPFLADEKVFIKEAVSRDLPCLGFCLGHQLLAHVLGARVGFNFAPSVGFITGFLTHAGREHPLFADLPRELILFKWHGQAVLEPLPHHLAVLATSGDCQVESFSVVGRPHIVGVQFDNHAVDPGDVATWLERDGKWLAALSEKKSIDPAMILAQARTLAPVLDKEFALLFKNWVGCVKNSRRAGRSGNRAQAAGFSD